MSLRVEQCNDAEVFHQLEKQVYANDPFHEASTPDFHGNAQGYVAYMANEPAACCIARPQTGNPHIGTIGSFQALENSGAVNALLQTAFQWLEKSGSQRIMAPIDGDTWHSYRFNTGDFSEPPFLKEPWNPPYYPGLLEGAGFEVAESYYTQIVDEPLTAAANQEKYYSRCLRNGYSFEPITKQNYESQLPKVYELSCRIFEQNVLYTPIVREEFLRLYRPAKALLQTGLSWMAYAPDKIPAGYVFTFPDHAEAVRAMGGKKNLPAKLRFLLNKRKATRTCIKTLGTIPEKQGSGLTAALTHLAYKNSAELGYSQTLMCLMHSSNDSRKFGGGKDRPFRSYALYELKK